MCCVKTYYPKISLKIFIHVLLELFCCVSHFNSVELSRADNPISI